MSQAPTVVRVDLADADYIKFTMVTSEREAIISFDHDHGSVRIVLPEKKWRQIIEELTAPEEPPR